ncbi:MAG: extracellular solute-binding protein [Treponema sp.]|jgi:putative aldouronate transport system substrate-binding protein|nr:extracellular solute-binding protein [Treponema sp.]
MTMILNKKDVILFTLILFLIGTLMSCGGGTKKNAATAEQNTRVTVLDTSGYENITAKYIKEEYLTFSADDLSYPFSDKPITVTVMQQRSGTAPQDFSDMWFLKMISELTNITFKYQLVESSVWEERKNLAFASGDYPDVFFHGITPSDELKYGPDGVFIDLLPLFKQYAPNIITELKQYPDVVKAIVQDNGAIYCLPMISYAPMQEAIPSRTNRKWLEKVGLDVPKTTDDLYAVLKAYKNQDPNGNGEADEIPISRHTMLILSAFGFVDKYNDVIDGKYYFVPAQDNYRAYLAYMAKLYREGLLDNDYFVQDDAQFNLKVSNRRVGFIESEPYVLLPNPEDYLQWIGIPPLTSEVNNKPCWPGISLHYQRSAGSAVITDKCKNPEAVVKFLNYIQTFEGTVSARLGPEDGKWSGRGGYTYEAKDSRHIYGAKIMVPEPFASYYEFRTTVTPIGMPSYVNPMTDDITVSSDPSREGLVRHWAEAGVSDVKRLLYDLQYRLTEDELTRDAYYVSLATYADQMTAKFITGETALNDTTWNNYIRELKSMGLDEMSALRQAGYNRYQALPDKIN